MSAATVIVSEREETVVIAAIASVNANVSVARLPATERILLRRTRLPHPQSLQKMFVPQMPSLRLLPSPLHTDLLLLQMHLLFLLEAVALRWHNHHARAVATNSTPSWMT